MAETRRTTRVQIASYNTNLQGNQGLPQDLVDWLQPTLETSLHLGPPDILAVGFQELLPLYLGFAGATRSVVDSRNDLILKQLRLHTGTDYALVERSVNVGVALLVYARDDGVGRRITDVQKTWTGCGPLWMGNKGGVGIRFRVKSDSKDYTDEVFTFVNVHLTAHAYNLSARLHDYIHIVRTLLFPAPTFFSHSSSTMYQTTHLFMSGDMNFRLVDGKDISPTELTSKLNTLEGRRELAQRDELSLEMKKGNVCNGFYEGDFTAFKPTYKYLLGSVDTYSAKRVPAWTDRILFTTYTDTPEGPISGITPLVYTSVPSYTTSDHKPVLALLEVPTPSADPDLESEGSTSVAPTLYPPPAYLQPAAFPNISRYTGKAVGWLVGYVWSLFYFIGMGRSAVGVGNFVVGMSVWTWWKRSSVESS